tara:strand:- start:379 stop:864 length:486 start_codon:yes stop_codon:yes gene_type:complete
MSSYIVNKEHIEQIVLYMYKLKSHNVLTYYYNNNRIQFDSIDDIAVELSKANCEGVNYRYDDDNQPYNFDNLSIASLKVKNPLQVIQLIRSLEYQSCDLPNYKDTKGCAILEQMTQHIISYMIQHECELHATDSYKLWDYNEDNILSYVRVQVVHKSKEVA